MNAHPSTANEWQHREEQSAVPEDLLFELRIEAFCQAFLLHPDSAPDVICSVLSEGLQSHDKIRVYRHAIIALMGCGDFEVPVPSCALSANVAWLLKDVAELTYAQIGEVLHISEVEAGRKIHEVRETVLAMASLQ